MGKSGIANRGIHNNTELCIVESIRTMIKGVIIFFCCMSVKHGNSKAITNDCLIMENVNIKKWLFNVNQILRER